MRRLFFIFIILVVSFAVPQPVSITRAQTFDLVAWSPQQADEVVASLAGFVDGQGEQAFDLDYRAVAFAAAEAAYRFPAAAQRAFWQWQQAYYTSLTNAPAACELYSALLQNGLTAGDVSVSEAEDWLSLQEPRKQLVITDLGPRQGFAGSSLYEIAAVGQPALHFLALHTALGRTLIYPLCSGRILTGAGSLTETHLADLTGDGLPELILADYRADNLDFGLTVFNLASLPPRQLPFSLPGKLANARWAVLPPDAGQRQSRLIVEGDLHLDLGCPLAAQEEYGWRAFQLQTTRSQLVLDALVRDGDAPCAQALFEQALDRVTGGSISAHDTLRALIDAWPAECEPGALKHPFSLRGCLPDVKDEARFRTALALAQAGEVNRVWAELRAISDRPSVPDSTWIQPARDFLRNYPISGRLAQACQASGACYPYIDLSRAVRQTSIAFRRSLIPMLTAYGIPILASGEVDLDGNGLNEHWFTVPGTGLSAGGIPPLPGVGPSAMIQKCTPPECQPELWLVVQSNRRFWAQSLGVVDPAQPPAFSALPDVDHLTSFTVANAVEPAPLVLLRDPVNGAVEVQSACAAFQLRLDEIEAGLLEGAVSASLAARSLASWQPVAAAECEPEVLLEQRPRMLYLLGLAREMSGERRPAAAAYGELVSTEPGSLYAYMASARLGLDQ